MRKLEAYRIYLIYHVATAMFSRLLFTVMMFYYVDTVGLNPLQLVLVGTALEISILAFEVPTGIVADLYSRRLSIIIGLWIMGVGFLLCASTWFPLIFFAQMVWGFGYTFTSGATNAWLSDEIGEVAANAAFLRGSQMQQIASIVGIIISVILASINILIPIFIGGIGLIAEAVFLTLFMDETGFTPVPKEERKGTFGDMQQTFGNGVAMVRRRPILVNILIIGVILGAFSEGYDRLWVAHLLEQFTLPHIGDFKPVVWIGIIGVVGSLLGAAATEITRRRVDLKSQERIVHALQIVNGLLIVALLVFTLAGHFWLMLVAIWSIGTCRTIMEPLFSAWINQGLDPKVRATVFSMAGQADAIGQLAGGPGIGLIAKGFSIRVALIGSTIILTPIMAMFRVTKRSTRTADMSQIVESGT